MRLLRVFAFLIALTVPAWGVPAQIAQQSCGGSNNCTTSAINTTGANFLVIGISEFAASAITPLPTDSKGNTWTGLTSRGTGVARCRLYYSIPSSVGSGHTFTFSDSGQFPGLVVMAFSGMNASPFHTETGNFIGTNTNSIQPGSLTPVVTNSLVVTILSFSNSGLPTINSSFSSPFGIDTNTTGANEGVFMSYLIQSPAAAINPTWSRVASAPLTTAIADFTPFVAAANAPAHKGSGVW